MPLIIKKYDGIDIVGAKIVYFISWHCPYLKVKIPKGASSFKEKKRKEKIIKKIKKKNYKKKKKKGKKEKIKKNELENLTDNTKDI